MFGESSNFCKAIIGFQTPFPFMWYSWLSTRQQTFIDHPGHMADPAQLQGRRIIPGGAEKSQQYHKYCLQYST